MNRDEILNVLKQNQKRLEGYGVEHLAVFGSHARGQARYESDIDVIVRFSPDVKKDWSYLQNIEAARDELSRLLDNDVDLITEPVSKPRLRAQVDRDRIHVF